MLDICLLGTGGMKPLPYRFLTSLMIRYNGSAILIDCGEATQVALAKKGLSPNPVDIILITHYHADHVSGLVGFLLTMGNSDRTKTVQIIGPPGLKRVVDGLRVIAPDLPFKLLLTEIESDAQVFSFDGFSIHAFKLNHNIDCYGYSFNLPRAGMFDVNRANAQGIEQRFWSRLQKGETIIDGDRTLTPDMVLGAPRRGLKVTYCTDTRPCPAIYENAPGSDLFICEGMHGDESQAATCKKHKHMTFTEAAKIGRKADVDRLWLTHFSPAMQKPQEYAESVKKIFERTVIAKDGQSLELKFT